MSYEDEYEIFFLKLLKKLKRIEKDLNDHKLLKNSKGGQYETHESAMERNNYTPGWID